MMNLLQAGKTLCVLAVICLVGIFTRLMAGSFYKRSVKENTNMALTKNKYLRGLKQNTEDAYRMNQGMNSTRVYLERQTYNLRTFGISVRGLDNLSGQLTLLCFLISSGIVLLSYWFRSDNYYIILCGTTGILAGMSTVLADYGMNLESRRQQLFTRLQDCLENVIWPRMNREGTTEHIPTVTAEEDRGGSANLRSIGRDRHSNSNNRRGLEQTAANREKQEERSEDNWLQDLNPEQKRMLEELLKEFIS